MRRTEWLIKKNPRFRRYVDRYCESRSIEREEALRHNLVDEVRKEYEGDFESILQILF